MWTIRQARRWATVTVAILPAMMLAFAVRAALSRDWVGVAIVLAIGAAFVAQNARRVRRDPEAASGQGFARDEREAYIQLRGLAAVGQAAILISFGLLAAVIVTNPHPRWYTWLVILLFGGLGLVQAVTVGWLRRRS